MNTSSHTVQPGTGPAGDEPRRGAVFITTQWSAVLAAGRSDTTQARAALEQLCRHYWHPLYAYVRRAGYRSESPTTRYRDVPCHGCKACRHTLSQQDLTR